MNKKRINECMKNEWINEWISKKSVYNYDVLSTFSSVIQLLLLLYIILDPEGEWNEHKVEITLWTHQVASNSFPDLLVQTKKRQGDETKGASHPKKQKKA